MTEKEIRKLLDGVKAGEVDVAEALNTLRHLPFEDMGFARVDHHRELRRGYPETIFSSGKTVEQIKKIASSMLERNTIVMATRAGWEVYEAFKELSDKAAYYEDARIATIAERENAKTKTKILVMSAGTSDIPVAEEAAVTAEIMGNRVERLYDVGVAGIHRLMSNMDKIRQASAIIVVAGMDGALPSVVGGLAAKPVIAVPTSIGYGAALGGLSALFTMLNNCAGGVTVVNIDNGYGAGYAASMINKLADETA